MAEMRLRALFGLFEGDPDDVVFAGAVSEITWELSDDEEWDRHLARFKENAPGDTTDWREVWITVQIDPATFAVPTLPGAVSLPKESTRDA